MISAAGHSAPCVRCNKWIHREPKSHSSIPPGHCRLLAVIPSLFLRLDTMPAQRDAAPRVGIPTSRRAVQQCILHLKWQNANALCGAAARRDDNLNRRPGALFNAAPSHHLNESLRQLAHRRAQKTRVFRMPRSMLPRCQKQRLLGSDWQPLSTP